MTRFRLAILLILATACGKGAPRTTPAPEASVRASAAQLDSLLATAQSRMDSRDWDKAAVLYQRLLLELPPGDRRLAAARLALGEARLGEKSYLQAVREFRRTADDYPTDSLAPHALLRAGDGYAALWRRPELDPTYGGQAIATWQELLTRYPESGTADTARTRIAGLQEWYAQKEFRAADFYLKYKAFDSAILYLKDLVTTYPKSSIVPDALVKLVDAYRQLGYSEDVQETCGYFRQTHPEAPSLRETCPAVAGDSTAVAGAPPAS